MILEKTIYDNPLSIINKNYDYLSVPYIFCSEHIVGIYKYTKFYFESFAKGDKMRIIYFLNNYYGGRR